MDTAYTGVVKFFNFLKGYGFLCKDGVDYFVHVTDILNGDILLENEEVQFKPVEGNKGWQAIEVVRILPPSLNEEEGTVKFYDVERGFGFVARVGKADVFIHFTDITGEHKELAVGTPVRFHVKEGRDGRDRAYKIEINI